MLLTTPTQQGFCILRQKVNNVLQIFVCSVNFCSYHSTPVYCDADLKLIVLQFRTPLIKVGKTWLGYRTSLFMVGGRVRVIECETFEL